MAPGSIYLYHNNNDIMGQALGFYLRMTIMRFWVKIRLTVVALVVANTKTFLKKPAAKVNSFQPKVQLSTGEQKLWSNGLNGV